MIGTLPIFFKWLKEDRWELKKDAPKEIIDYFNKYNEEYKKLRESSY